MSDKDSEQRALGDLFDGAIEPHRSTLSLVKSRLIEASASIRQDAPDEITYQHTVLCQTALPVRRPDVVTRIWERRQGRAALSIEAGRVNDPVKGCFVELPLPFGPKARLVLMHLNSEAIRTQSPEIEVEDSMTGFVRRLSKQTTDPNGREIRAFKEQLSALSAATVRLAVVQGEQSRQINTHIVGAFDLWFPKDARQRVLWPSSIWLSTDYFTSLLGHAVPLDERAVASLAHSAMALDVYSWLAQRLHRIKPSVSQFIPWTALHEQFGQGYKVVRFFRRDFMTTLRQVTAAYPEAKLSTDNTGLVLLQSPPPIAKRLHVLTPTTDNISL